MIIKKYRSIVFYLEACESGSMFNNLLRPDINVYAVTAANPNESSYACCFDPIVNAYLGDEFSVNWLENSDNFKNIFNETLNDQFNIVRNNTLQSHVCMYGNTSMSKNKLSRYLLFNNQSKQYRDHSEFKTCDLIDSRDVKVETLIRLILSNTGKKNTYYDELDRELFHKYMLTMMYGTRQHNDLGCYPKERIDTHCLEKKN